MTHRTNVAGVELRPRDYRGLTVPLGPLPHQLGGRHRQHIDVQHACPVCVLGHPAPFCPVCLGAGTVTADRLERLQAVHEAEHR